VLGAGTFLGIQVMPDNFEPWIVMILPAGAFIVLGFWLLVFTWLQERRRKPEEMVMA
jgi:Na+-translocating ferredoxin:NAD+ oxidoreductase subunit E